VFTGFNFEKGNNPRPAMCHMPYKTERKGTPSFLLGYLGKKKSENLEHVIGTLLKLQKDRYKAKNCN